MALCSPYLGGSLNFGGQAMCFSNPQGSLNAAYCYAMKANQTNYNNIIRDYQTLASQQTGEFNQLLAGYATLCGRIQSQLCGIENAQLTAAKCVFTKNAANIQNQFISGGLNVSSTLGGVARGNAAQYAQAQCQTRGHFGELKAGYMANTGLAALNAQQSGIMANTALGAQQLQFMGRDVNIPFPCQGLYQRQYGANMARFANTGGGGGSSARPSNCFRGLSAAGRGPGVGNPCYNQQSPCSGNTWSPPPPGGNNPFGLYDPNSFPPWDPRSPSFSGNWQVPPPPGNQSGGAPDASSYTPGAPGYMGTDSWSVPPPPPPPDLASSYGGGGGGFGGCMCPGGYA